jgi:sugar/nucleoside kinase (ribokinase family)
MPLPKLPPQSAARPFDVVGFGESSLDFVAVVSDAISPDAKLPLDRFEALPGGQTATALVACARLGHRARYVGALGRDDAGTTIERALTNESVDVAAIWREAAPSRVAVVLVDRATGVRTVLERRDARLTLRLDEIDQAVVASGRVLMVDAVDLEASIFAARAARAAGVPVVVDVDRPGPRAHELLRHIDVIVVPRSFLDAAASTESTGEALRRLDAEFQPAIAIATLGAEGSLARFEGREIRTPAFSVPVVDTTGAGDAFRAGFVSAWLRSGDVPDVLELLRRANAVAALNCRGLGAQGALPTPTELDGVL